MERAPGKNPAPDLRLPEGRMNPIGYVVVQHSERRNRPVKSYQKWIARIPGTYRQYVKQLPDELQMNVQDDPACLAVLKHYRSLMPMAQESRKPLFFLKPADGALGAHSAAVRDAYRDFMRLSQTIAERAGISSRQ
jgi:chromosome partitioning protein